MNETFFLDLSLRFAINLLTMVILIRRIYYPLYKTREWIFTFIIFNLIIFFISYLLNRVELSMGAAFGLFAVFSMLRYRTEDISIKDMTYLFLSIATGLISSIVQFGDKSGEMLGYTQVGYNMLSALIINSVILIATWLLEGNIFMQRECMKSLMYENIELIKPEREAELLEDLRQRTGLKVHRVNIEKIDF